jgi:hypothetical protein
LTNIPNLCYYLFVFKNTGGNAMAYISKLLSPDEVWRGPYPNKAGEFCGNIGLSDPDLGRDVLKTKRLGAPSSCLAGTSIELQAKGMAGLYLLKDQTYLGGYESREVDTDVLCEEVVTGQRPPNKPFLPGVPMANESRPQFERMPIISAVPKDLDDERHFQRR